MSAFWVETEKWSDSGQPTGPSAPQCSTSDQPIHHETKYFIYVNDTAVAAPGSSFKEVEQKLERTLDD